MKGDLSLREKINKAIIKRVSDDPRDRFKIEYLDREKGIAEVYIVWDKYDREIMSVKYED